MKENYQIYLPYQFRPRVQSVSGDPQLPHKKMKTLFLSNMSKSRRLTSTFFPITREPNVGEQKIELGHNAKKIVKVNSLFQWNETRRVGSSNTRATVLDWFVRDGEFAEIVANHLGLDFNLIEGFALIDAHDASHHLGHDDHISQVGLDGLGLLVGEAGLFRLAELLDESHRLALETARQFAADATRKQLHQLIRRHVQQLVKVDTSVGVLPEGSLLGLNFRHFRLI